MSGEARKNQVTWLVTLRHRLIMSGALGLGTRIHERFAALGGMDIELPERSERPRAAELDA